MHSSKANPEAAEIPQEIIGKFLDQLTAEKISPDIVSRLRKTMLEEGDISETAIRVALTAGNEPHD
jgi:hypothetical protein